MCLQPPSKAVPEKPNGKKKDRHDAGLKSPCAQNRNRTCTPFPKQDFESSASTNSAIWAIWFEPRGRTALRSLYANILHAIRHPGFNGANLKESALNTEQIFFSEVIIF